MNVDRRFFLTYSHTQLSFSSTPFAFSIRDHYLQCGFYKNQCDNYFLLRFVRAQSPRPRLRKYHISTDNTSISSICSPQPPGEGTKKILLVEVPVLRDHLPIPLNVCPPTRIIHVLPRLRPYTSFRIQILLRDNMLPILCKVSAYSKTSSRSGQSRILTICTSTRMEVLTSALKFVLPSTPPTTTIPPLPSVLLLPMSPRYTIARLRAKGTLEVALPLTT